MTPLKLKIIERIKSEGPISFETFMDMALYYPELGYYSRPTAVIGRAGDFYTSPHLHRIFGAMAGRQMEEMWRLMGCPGRFDVVEMGAGMGYLAKDMLDYLGGRESGREREIFSHLHYTIIEPNRSTRSAQESLLAGFPGKIGWHRDLSDLKPFSGCFLSNELLDAFPVRMVVMEEDLMEIFVSAEDDDLKEVKMRAGDDIAKYFREFSVELHSGCKTEVNLRIRDWLMAVAEKFVEGFVLTVDYGYPAWDYYSEDRSKGTLLCYHRHQMNEDPFENVGEQDITAHVNFSSLKKWGEELGLRTVGFCPQGTYLVSLGIDEVITELYGASPDAFDIAKIKGLIFPQGMGESHKVMVQHKGEGGFPLRGFELRNQVSRL